ncbi:MAG TPA: trypsin-like peptidase domain-containing protein [Chloroflexia bacterium]|nr:trypsin-like peptidase domain-containing protein [Chloroflexia bacterium]
MDNRQQRLVEYFRGLTPPAPPMAAPTEQILEESFQPAEATSDVPKSTSDFVRDVLTKKRVQSGPSALEESTSPEVRLEVLSPPGLNVAPTLLPGRVLQPVEMPLADRDVEIAMSAADKALNDQPLTPQETDFLEAIVLPGLRPVLDIIRGNISTPPAGWEWLDGYRKNIQQILPSIGRINAPGLQTLPYIGTGFFVGDGLILTNRHVASFFVIGAGTRPEYLVFRHDLGTNINSQYEVGDPDPDPESVSFRVVDALLVHPHWDAAILQVEPVGDAKLPQPLKLAREMPRNFSGGTSPDIFAIGYPQIDERERELNPEYYAQQVNIFRSISGRKRLMPGQLKGFEDVSSTWGTIEHAATHDASTLGGNSGSAVIDRDSGLVVALHFAGRYLKNNYSVPTWELAQDSRIRDLGVNFADYPGAKPDSGEGPDKPIWLDAWKTIRPIAPVGGVPTAPPGTEGPSSGVALTNAALMTESTHVLPVSPDWFERVSDNDLVEAMHRDPQATERLIRATLTASEAEDLIKDLKRGIPLNEEATEEALFDTLFGAPKVDPTLPEIIFLHGVMGGHLAAYGGLGGRVWLSPLAFVAGGVADRLMLAEDGERDRTQNQVLYADGHIRLVYEKAARKWRMRGFVVHEFSYDWRKPISNSADRLHFFIESLRLDRPGNRFALVAHSMGGLVAALYAVRHPEWSSRISQTILMGTPLRGSFAPIEALLGSYSLFPKVALVDTRDEISDYVAMARTLPGLIDMLPDPDLFSDAALLYQRANWLQKRAPAQVWLDQSRQLKRLIAASPLLETASLIVSPNHPTIGDVGMIGGQIQLGRRIRAGDGTVPTRSAAAGGSGAVVYRASSLHGDLPRDDAVIKAIDGLLKNGTCELPTLSQAVINDTTPIEEAVTETVEEATAVELPIRLRAGLLTQNDADFLTRSDRSTLRN